MSWLYSRALVGEFLAGSLQAFAPYARWSLTPTVEAFLSHDKTTEVLNLSPSGMTCEPLTDSLGAVILTWCRAASLAKTLAVPESASELQVGVVDYGRNSPESSVKYNRDTRLLKIRHIFGHEDSMLSSATLPRWGTMHNGVVWERTTPARLTNANACGSLLPTPRAFPGGMKIRKPRPPRPAAKSPGLNLEERLGRDYPELVGSLINPRFVEYLMGWPMQWTSLEPLAMDKFQQWYRWFGSY